MSDTLHRVPVFPLPRVVLFPGAVLPLHIFEPRYRQMVRDALASRGEIAVVLPRPGWEARYTGAFPVHDVGCLGSLETVRPLPDGRFLLRLVGLSRVRFEEWRQLVPYRIARCRPLPEVRPDPACPDAARKALALSATFHELLRELAGVEGPLNLDTEPRFETTINRICYALDIDPEDKQALLIEDDLMARAEGAERHLEKLIRSVARRRGSAPDGQAN